MKPFILSLKPGEAVRPAVAWFVGDTRPEVWLEEICESDLPQELLRLLVIPRSAGDPSALGVLVVAPGEFETKRPPRAVPYARLGERLYFPARGDISPVVTAEEFAGWSQFAHLVFHPVAGLVGFDEGDVLGLCDLLTKPARATASWNRAQAPTGLSRALQSIQLAPPEAMVGLFQGGDNDIGSKAGERVPGLPDEPGQGGGLWQKIRAGLKFGAAAGSDLLQRLREGELKRLLHLLASNPEEGLRYAVPLRPASSPTAPASGWKLPRREPRFDLGQPGKPAGGSTWGVPGDTFGELLRRYTELAVREANLGRFRRAAYIYAELLGDLPAAASMLERGGHWWEAAVLYRDHLRRRRPAADCFVKAGMLSEALALYEQEGDYMQVGALQTRLGRAAEALAAYRKATSRFVRQGDHLRAAEVAEQKLNDPEEALRILWLAWPSRPQANACLAAAFRLAGRLGKHGQVSDRLDLLRLRPPPGSGILPVTRILAEVSRSYPDMPLRGRAGDLARVLAAGRLAGGDGADSRALIQALAGIVPRDRLFPRDANRFCDFHAKSRVHAQGAAEGKVVRVADWHLGRGVVWKALQGRGGEFLALGYSRSGREPVHLDVVMARGSWRGGLQRLEWRLERSDMFCPLFDVDPEFTAWACVKLRHSYLGWYLEEKRFPAVEGLFDEPLRAGTPPWLPADVVGLAADQALFCVRHAESRYVLCSFAWDGTLLGSWPMPGLEDEHMDLICSGPPLPPSLPMAAQWGSVFVAQGCQLFILSPARTLQAIRFDGEIERLDKAPPHTEPALAVSTKEGLSVLWPGRDSVLPVTESRSAAAAFLRNGLLAVSSLQGHRIFDLDGSGIRRALTFRPRSRQVRGMAAGAKPNEFGVLYADGTLELFAVGCGAS